VRGTTNLPIYIKIKPIKILGEIHLDGLNHSRVKKFIKISFKELNSMFILKALFRVKPLGEINKYKVGLYIVIIQIKMAKTLIFLVGELFRTIPIRLKT
jgi:hypothetical protein